MFSDLAIKLIGIAIICGMLSLGVHEYNNHLRKEGEDKATAIFKPRAERAEAALETSEKEREKYETETKRLGGLAHDASEQLAVVRRANGDLVASGERLRRELAAVRAAKTGVAPAPAGGSQTTDPADDLYADVQRRLDEASDGIAQFADESRIRGLTCERAFEVKQ